MPERNLAIELKQFLEVAVPFLNAETASWGIASGIAIAMRHPEWAQWFYNTEIMPTFSDVIKAVDEIVEAIPTSK